MSQQAAALAADAAAGVGGRLMAIKFLEELVLVCNPDSWPSQMLVSPAQVPCTAHDSSSDWSGGAEVAGIPTSTRCLSCLQWFCQDRDAE